MKAALVEHNSDIFPDRGNCVVPAENLYLSVILFQLVKYQVDGRTLARSVRSKYL